MSKHDTFGIPGSPRGINNGSHILKIDCFEPLFELVFVLVCLAFLECILQLNNIACRFVEVIEEDYITQVRELSLCLRILSMCSFVPTKHILESELSITYRHSSDEFVA